MEDHFFSPAALLVAIGIIIFFVSLIGCVGAVKGSTCLVNIYGLFLILLLILEVAAAIAAYSMRGNIGDYIHEAMKDSMDKYDENHYVVEAWDGLQCRMQCCGIDGSSDWDNRNITVPETCFSSSGVEFDFGCHYRLMNLISESALLVGTAAICVAIVQALGIVFAFMLAKSIRRIKTAEERKRQENRARLYEQLARGNDEKPTPVIYTANSSA